ncbi:MAG: nusB [Rickettsiales bacterium]|jgi:N utilization substance protein B|nr:nusB [Rickettsiales bacterium]
MTSEQAKSLPKGIIRRSAARLAAVQALYSAEIGAEGKNPETLALELIQFYTPAEGDEGEGRQGVQLDAPLLKILISGVLSEQETLDGYIVRHLAEDWKISRIGAVLRAILRTATFELLKRADVPTKVVINEYIEVARAFLDEEDVRFTNGIVDAIAREVRK